MKKAKLLVTLLLSLCLAVLFTGCQCSHEWKEATCTIPKTCAKCGISEGEPIGHNWIEATCTTPKTCKICDETEGEANGHSVRLGKCPICGEISTVLLKEANNIITEVDNITNAGMQSTKYLSDSYDFSTDKYQRQYVDKARIALLDGKYAAERAIIICGEYEEFISTKTKLNQILALIVDERIMGAGNYKDIRSTMVESLTSIRAIVVEILEESKSWIY